MIFGKFEKDQKAEADYRALSLALGKKEFVLFRRLHDGRLAMFETVWTYCDAKLDGYGDKFRCAVELIIYGSSDSYGPWYRSYLQPNNAYVNITKNVGTAPAQQGVPITAEELTALQVALYGYESTRRYEKRRKAGHI